MNASGTHGAPPPADLDYVRFPPRWHNVLVPSRPGSAATVGMSLYTAAKPLPVLLQQGLWALARVSGARILPGPRETWTPPLEVAVFADLWSQWTQAAGRPLDGLAVYERLQSERATLTVLVCAGASSMLVRVRPDPADLAAELAMSEAAHRRGTDGFAVPACVGRGEAGAWHWAGYEAIATRPHLPRYRLDAAAFAGIRELVEAVVPRPADVPAHWQGAHGDVVPWNLRRGRGRTWLIDWEDAGWAPPGTDETYLAAVVAAMRRGRVRPLALPDGHHEARQRWLEIVRDRPTSEVEQRLRTRLITALAGPDAADR